MKNAGDVLDPRQPIVWWPAVVLFAAGIAAALLPAVAGLPLFGFAGMALMLAGGGRMSADDVQAALEARDRSRCGPMAPACGLTLTRVDYPDAA